MAATENLHNQRHRGPFFDHLSASTMSSAAPQNCRGDLTWRAAWGVLTTKRAKHNHARPE